MADDEAPAPCPTCGTPIEPEYAERLREQQASPLERIAHLEVLLDVARDAAQQATKRGAELEAELQIRELESLPRTICTLRERALLDAMRAVPSRLLKEWQREDGFPLRDACKAELLVRGEQ